MHTRRHRRLVAGEHLVVGKVLCEVADIRADRGRHKQPERCDNAEEIADETYHARSSLENPVSGAAGRRLVSAKQSRSLIVSGKLLSRRYGQNTAAQRGAFQPCELNHGLWSNYNDREAISSAACSGLCRGEEL